MTTMSAWMVHQYSVLFNAENEALRNSILQACGLIKEEIISSAQVGPILYCKRQCHGIFFCFVIFSKFLEL
jgi:hypothetical protein